MPDIQNFSLNDIVIIVLVLANFLSFPLKERNKNIQKDHLCLLFILF